jgi:hypothetical protein
MTSWLYGPILFFFSLLLFPFFFSLSTQNALYILIPALLVFFFFYCILYPSWLTERNRTIQLDIIIQQNVCLFQIHQLYTTHQEFSQWGQDRNSTKNRRWRTASETTASVLQRAGTVSAIAKDWRVSTHPSLTDSWSF